jgi:hypothetical protein
MTEIYSFLNFVIFLTDAAFQKTDPYPCGAQKTPTAHFFLGLLGLGKKRFIKNL